MIVPMKKVSLIIKGDKKIETLKKLRKMGILHIEIEEGSGEKLVQLKEQIALFEGAIFTLEETKQKNAEVKEASTEEAVEIANEIHTLSEEKKELAAKLLALEVELERVKKWGDIDPQTVAELSENGIEIAFYEASKTVYDGLGESVKTICLENTKSSVKFVLVKTGAEGEKEVIESLNSFRFELPEISTNEMKEKIEELKGRMGEIDSKIISYAGYIKSFKKAIKACDKDVEFEIYATGMMNESLSADGDLSVSYFTAYVEEDNIDDLKKVAKENSWGLIIEEPTEEDNVPTKLKNNKFVSLIYPLTDFLGTVPGYFEYDISAWFLGFILIFFGMIFGDGGYGLIVTAVAAIPIIKSIASKKKVQPTFLLVALFGLSTILWGMVTCTWFGLAPEQLPGWLKALSVPFISNVYADKIWVPFWMPEGVGLTTAQNLQIFCFTLAILQMGVAHAKGAIRTRKSLKMLGDIGSILQFVGMYYVVLSLVVNAKVFPLSLVISGIPVGLIAIGFIAVGFVLSFVFSNYEGNIVQSILASLADIVSVLLGIVNVFGDIVSYIRLWAVGLAGAAISATVNDLAGPLFGKFAFMIVAIIILVFGHGLNMILNVLSVIVHGIRLNTLEFSSHLGMSWSGHKFKPFEEQN